MMQVVKPLKVLALPLEGLVAMKPLTAKEFAVVRVIKSFNRPISPGLANGNENGLDPVVQA